jgi:acyl carrier protein
MMLVVAIENQFQIELTTEEVIGLDSFEDAVTAVRSREIG